MNHTKSVILFIFTTSIRLFTSGAETQTNLCHNVSGYYFLYSLIKIENSQLYNSIQSPMLRFFNSSPKRQLVLLIWIVHWNLLLNQWWSTSNWHYVRLSKLMNDCRPLNLVDTFTRYFPYGFKSITGAYFFLIFFRPGGMSWEFGMTLSLTIVWKVLFLNQERNRQFGYQMSHFSTQMRTIMVWPKGFQHW